MYATHKISVLITKKNQLNLLKLSFRPTSYHRPSQHMLFFFFFLLSFSSEYILKIRISEFSAKNICCKEQSWIHRVWLIYFVVIPNFVDPWFIPYKIFLINIEPGLKVITMIKYRFNIGDYHFWSETPASTLTFIYHNHWLVISCSSFCLWK